MSPREQTETHVPDHDLVVRLLALATSLLSDSMDRTGGILGVLPVTRTVRAGHVRMVGSALTVHTARGDNLAVHQALEQLERGQVLVVAAGGNLDRAIVGEIMCSYAAQRGAAGVVVDGAVRDSVQLAAAALPVFAAGITHHGPYKNGPGTFGKPVCAGGTMVHDGDMVVGDADGVVVVPRTRAVEVSQLAQARGADEERILDSIRQGTYSSAYA